MAEAVGLTLGVVALVSLFDTCVDLADRVELASNLGKDYEVAFTRFLLLKSRLNAWGTTLKVFEPGSTVDQTTKDRWVEERILVGRTLHAIKYLLSDGMDLEKKYGMRQIANKDDSARILQEGHSRTLQEVEEGLEASIKYRQRKTQWNRKFTWAIGDKKKFDELIANLSAFVAELENLALRLNVPNTSSVVEQSLHNVQTPEAQQLIQVAANTSSPMTTAPVPPTINPTVQADLAIAGVPHDTGHLYVHNLIDQKQALVLAGNVDMADGPNNRYIGNEIRGGKLIMGNTSGDFAKMFFGLS